MKSINVFCGYSDWHHLVGCITKLHISRPIPLRVTYKNLKYFDQKLLKEQVSQIPFHISSIFDDVSDQSILVKRSVVFRDFK